MEIIKQRIQGSRFLRFQYRIRIKRSRLGLFMIDRISNISADVLLCHIGIHVRIWQSTRSAAVILTLAVF